MRVRWRHQRGGLDLHENIQSDRNIQRTRGSHASVTETGATRPSP